MIVSEGWHHQHLVLVESLPHVLELLHHEAQAGGLVAFVTLGLSLVFL